eukprot:Em0008g62a
MSPHLRRNGLSLRQGVDTGVSRDRRVLQPDKAASFSVDTIIGLAKRFPQLDLADSASLDQLREEFIDFTLSPDLPAPDETQVHFQEIECWSTIQYYELNQKVGLPFKPATMQAYVNGYTDTVTKDRLSLGSLTNTSRNEKTESARRHIGHGVQLSYVCGELFVDCLSDYAVFIQSKIVARALGLPPLSVMKLPPGGSTKIFSTLEFSKLLHETVADGYKATFDLTNFCSVYLSFIKGWGPEYHRQTVNGTPCWVEIQMHGPLVWLDKVLIELGPTTKITSKS